MNSAINTTQCLEIFDHALHDYRDKRIKNDSYASKILLDLLYDKHWIDNVQWDEEDQVRDLSKSAEERIQIKESIDQCNQRRTDIVEAIDGILYDLYKGIPLSSKYRLNTETPAWALDRLSILHIKIYQMRSETVRVNASDHHKLKSLEKLSILEKQRSKLCLAIDQLLAEIGKGECKIQRYHQMKMYNDSEFNPILRKSGL